MREIRCQTYCGTCELGGQVVARLGVVPRIDDFQNVLNAKGDQRGRVGGRGVE
jgi:hypothetical protein